MEFKISLEQSAVVEALCTSNVIVDSVAGSGKTTTCLEISKAFQNSSILLLTYNSRLRQETRKRIVEKGLKNMEVHTYHSFILNYYPYQTIDDIKLKEAVVIKNIQPKKSIDFNIFIIDEAQDMNDLFCKTFLKILMDNKYQKQSFKICILGDWMQSIYSFNGADSRYITLSDQLYGNLNPFSWRRLDLSQSFRLTQQTAEFINKCMLPSDRLFSNRQGPKPIYLICDSFTNTKQQGQTNNKINVIYNKIMHFIDQENYDYEDFFILAPSLKNKKTSPVGLLSNLLSKKNVPIFIPNNDEDKIDQEIIKSKIVFSTFHQVKGLERQVVFIFGFDISYFQYNNRNAIKSKCTNELYVAASRALKQLVLIHHDGNEALPFLRKKNIFEYCKIEGNTKVFDIKNEIIKPLNDDKVFSVTELTKHMSLQVMEQCLSYLDTHQIQYQEETIQILQKSNQKMTTQKGEDIQINEAVSEITGTAIPIYFEMQINKNAIVLEKSLQIIQNQQTDSTLQNIFRNSEDIIQKLNILNGKKPNYSPQDILFLANLWNSIKNGLNFKINQINNYSWLSEQQLQSCYSRFKSKVSNNLEFEKELKMFFSFGKERRHLVGFIDCIDKQDTTIWELKCTTELKGEHFIQLGLYMKLFATSQTSTYQQISFYYYQLSQIHEQSFEFEDELIYKLPDQKEIICKFIKYENEQIQYRYQNKTYYGKIQDFTKKRVRDLEDKIKEHEEEQQNILYKHKFKIFNILTNEIIEVRSDSQRLSQMLNLIIENKYGKQKNVEDDTFILNIHESIKYKNVHNKLNQFKYQISEGLILQDYSVCSSQTQQSQLTYSQPNSQEINTQILNHSFDTQDINQNLFHAENKCTNKINSSLIKNIQSNQMVFQEKQSNTLLEQYLSLSSSQQLLFRTHIIKLHQKSNKSQINNFNLDQQQIEQEQEIKSENQSQNSQQFINSQHDEDTILYDKEFIEEDNLLFKID